MALKSPSRSPGLSHLRLAGRLRLSVCLRQARWQAQALSLPPDPQEVLSFVGAAQAPSGYKILESCPSLETDENMQDLIGTQILHAWDDKDRQGWFEGKVHGRNLNARDLARAPTANFSVRYSKSLTVGVKKKKIIPLCHVAHELTSRTYGEKKWWVVIVKDQ